MAALIFTETMLSIARKNDTCSPVYQQVAGFLASDRIAVQFLNGTTYLYHSFLDR